MYTLPGGVISITLDPQLQIRDYILANFLRISDINRVREMHNVRVYERRKYVQWFN